MTEEIDRWIKFMKENPDKWKKIHTEFINAQFLKSRNFVKKLLKTPNGREKVINAFNIKNVKGYEGLMGEK